MHDEASEVDHDGGRRDHKEGVYDDMTMAQMVEIMRALQANVEASRIEQARMHEDLVASRARNEELSRVTEELRQAL